MRTSKKWALAGAALALAIVSSVFGYTAITGYASAPGKYDDFAQCLTEVNAIEYGAFWCHNCDNQKNLFGKSFKYINYVECDARGKDANPQACEEAGVEGYPTWIINDQKYTGTQPLQRLAALTGCELPN